jgi:hypothetical protein
MIDPKLTSARVAATTALQSALAAHHVDVHERMTRLRAQRDALDAQIVATARELEVLPVAVTAALAAQRAASAAELKSATAFSAALNASVPAPVVSPPAPPAPLQNVTTTTTTSEAGKTTTTVGTTTLPAGAPAPSMTEIFAQLNAAATAAAAKPTTATKAV